MRFLDAYLATRKEYRIERRRQSQERIAALEVRYRDCLQTALSLMFYGNGFLDNAGLDKLREHIRAQTSRDGARLELISTEEITETFGKIRDKNIKGSTLEDCFCGML
jgi:hypothetical protein